MMQRERRELLLGPVLGTFLLCGLHGKTEPAYVRARISQGMECASFEVRSLCASRRFIQIELEDIRGERENLLSRG